MRWHDYIFSEERKFRILRHLVFWTGWWLYFLLCYYLLQQPFSIRMKPGYVRIGENLPIKTLLITLLYALACYPLIYYILPGLIKRKWLKAAALFILLCIALFIVFHMVYWYLFPFIDALLGSSSATARVSRLWPATNLGLLNFAKVAAVTVFIKYLKYWWLKEKEGQRLEKEKLNADLQLLKAQVHPDFLFKALNNIYAHARSSSPRASGMLLKLSELLSYMLYECDRPAVPLKREIEMMKEYMQLEKIRYKDEPEIQVNIKGELNGKSIAPFLLLPFIENCFIHYNQMTEQFWINMDIGMENDIFTMKLTNGISDFVNDPEMFNTDGLINIQKRLTLLYPDRFQLKMSVEQEMFIVLLTIRGTDTFETYIAEKETVTGHSCSNQAIMPVLNYAPR